MPLLKSAAKAVGKEALTTTANIAADLAKGAVAPREALKSRGREAAGNLAAKLASHLNPTDTVEPAHRQQQGSRKRKRLSIKGPAPKRRKLLSPSDYIL
jgi:hypothetical protein